MKTYLLLSLLAVTTIPSLGQKIIKQYVERHAVGLTSIQPDHTNYDDLEAIGNAIGDARVVMLGEQDHGDGATMLAKTRLVKYLYEKKGFTVLAFENDFFALNEGWEQLPKEKEQINRFFRENLFSIWSNCGQCADLLYSFIPGTYERGAPLVIAGFDNQIFFKYSLDSLISSIDRYLLKQNIPFVQEASYREQYLPVVTALMRRGKATQDPAQLLLFESHTETILSQLPNRVDAEAMTIHNMAAFARQWRLAKESYQSSVVRDKQMARNLQWLVKEKYPDRKVIVWAANDHIMKNTTTSLRSKYLSYERMGTVFTSDRLNNEETYVLGFSSRTGSYRRVNFPEARYVPEPDRNGFETWVKDEQAYAFVDFKRFRLENPGFSGRFSMKGRGQSKGRGVWTEVFDGVFYIRDMFPCENIK